MTPRVLVSDLMTTELVLARPEMGVHQAAGLLRAHRISGLPVVDDAGVLVGILTEQDCLRSVFQSGYYEEPGRTVGDAMTRAPETLDAEADVMTAVDLFLQRPYRQFPVLRAGALVGVLSRSDALALVTRQA